MSLGAWLPAAPAHSIWGRAPGEGAEVESKCLGIGSWEVSPCQSAPVPLRQVCSLPSWGCPSSSLGAPVRAKHNKGSSCNNQLPLFTVSKISQPMLKCLPEGSARCRSKLQGMAGCSMLTLQVLKSLCPELLVSGCFTSLPILLLCHGHPVSLSQPGSPRGTMKSWRLPQDTAIPAASVILSLAHRCSLSHGVAAPMHPGLGISPPWR